MIFTKKAQRSTKDTKSDVDDASLCVLCVLFFSFVIKKCRFCSAYEKIRDDELMFIAQTLLTTPPSAPTDVPVPKSLHTTPVFSL